MRGGIMRDVLKPGQFVGKGARVYTVAHISVTGGDVTPGMYGVLSVSDPCFSRALEAAKDLFEDTHNPWVLLTLVHRIRKDGTDPEFFDGTDWVPSAFPEDNLWTGYRACLKAYGLE
jgi:hypothetical protein